MTGSTEALWERARRRIPGGCHTYSKGDDQFPANAPRLIERGEGCWCWDPDGGRWLDYGMGLRSVILGHCHPAVLDAVGRELARGSNFTRPSPLEGELAERLGELLPWAEMTKFAKNGSDVTTAAVRLARAWTGRSLVAACRSNPFYSFDDWWIGRTAMPAGIPQELAQLTLLFDYNDLDSLEELLRSHPDDVACVIMEPVAQEPPRPGFLAGVVELAHRHGALVVFDEMISGFRHHLRGSWGLYGVEPDLATFGKALGNGFSVAALCGRADVMRQGGSDPTRDRVFLLSATHGGETHALAAALACLDEQLKHDVAGHIRRLGARLKQGFQAIAAELGLSDLVACTGPDASPTIVCRDPSGAASPPFRTLFLQEMAGRGILIPYVAISLAHGAAEIDLTLAAVRQSLLRYREALAGDVHSFLRGPAVKPVFRRHD